MKESGIDWIRQIPEEWEIVKFKYLFNTSKGLSITKEHLVDEGIPVINYGQIHSSLTKQVQSCDVRLPFVANYYLSKKGVKLNQGDFVFADTSEDLEGAGNFSTRLDSTGQLLAGYHTIIARLNDYDEHDFRYFMHLFDSLAIRKQIQNKVSGVKVYSVTQGILNSIFVIIPPKSEQQKIADFLDKKTAQLDKVKSLLEEQIQKLKDYRASLIYKTVTKGLDKTVPMKDSGIDWIGQIPEEWRVSKVNHIFEEHKQKNRGNKEKNLLSLSYGRIIRKSIDSSFGLLPESFDTYNIIQRGDIVLRLTDLQNDKRSLRVGLARENGIITSAYLTLRLKNLESNDSYMYYLLHTYDICKVFYNFGGGVRQGGTWSDIYKMELLIPPCNEQQKIADFLDKKTIQIDKLIQIKNQQIENINKQRQTLIYDYVTGKRRV